MINSELREYCAGVISHYSKDYPYYVMCTNTSKNNNNYYSQWGATIYFSKDEVTANNAFSFTADSWLCVTVYSSNANYNDLSARVFTSNKSGTITINEYEYLYSNVDSPFAYSTVPQPTYYSAYQNEQNFALFGILISALLLVQVISIWLRK